VSNQPINNDLSDSSTQTSSAPSLLVSLYNKFICAFVGYFDGELKRFTLDASQQLTLVANTNSQSSPKIVIVSRHYYAENSKHYPVESKKELTKLLRLENPNTRSYFHIWGHENGQSQVNVWQVSEQVPSALLTLPESLLIALGSHTNTNTKQSQVITVQGAIGGLAGSAANNADSNINGNSNNTSHSSNNGNDNKTVQANSQQDLYVSQHQGAIYSSLQSPIINSAQRFMLSAGLSPQCQSASLTPVKAIQHFASGIIKMPLSLWTNLLNKNSAKQNLPALVANIAIPFITIFSAYLMISSAYLVMKDSSLQNQLHQQGEQIDLALKQQQQLDNNAARFTLISDFINKQDISSPFWLALAEVLPEVTLSNIRKVGNRYVIRGTTESATNTLEKISQLPNVIEAKFDTPSRKSRSKERFTIGFSLKHHALNLFLQETEPATPDNDALPDVLPVIQSNKSTSSNDFITPAKQKVTSTAKADVSNAGNNAGNNAMSNLSSKASNGSSDATSYASTDATSDATSDASSTKTTIVTSTKAITEGSKEASTETSSFTPQLAQNTNCYPQASWQRYVPARLEQFSSVMHSINKA
jgi:hypothetical protein